MGKRLTSAMSVSIQQPKGKIWKDIWKTTINSQNKLAVGIELSRMLYYSPLEYFKCMKTKKYKRLFNSIHIAQLELSICFVLSQSQQE